MNAAMRKLIVALPVLALAACDLTAEAEADRICVTQEFPDRPIPASPPGVTVPAEIGGLLSAFTFDVDIGAAVPEDLEEDGIDADVNARSIALTSIARNADFSGVTLLTFDVVPPAGSARPTVPFRYERAAGVATPLPAIEARPEAPIDLIDYLQGEDRIRITNLRIAGSAPAQAWAPALVTCGDTRVEVDYVEAAGL